MEIRVLVPGDAAAFRALRLEALRDDPRAFASSYEEEVERPLPLVAERLEAGSDGATFGAWRDGTLVGVVGIARWRHRKERHKALLWGMYVSARWRGRGVGRRLVRTALEHARGMAGLRQVHLAVGSYNHPATALYRSAGFEPFGVEPHALIVDGVPIDEIHMVCVVRP